MDDLRPAYSFPRVTRFLLFLFVLSTQLIGMTWSLHCDPGTTPDFTNPIYLASTLQNISSGIPVCDNQFPVLGSSYPTVYASFVAFPDGMESVGMIVSFVLPPMVGIKR